MPSNRFYGVALGGELGRVRLHFRLGLCLAKLRARLCELSQVLIEGANFLLHRTYWYRARGRARLAFSFSPALKLSVSGQHHGFVEELRSNELVVPK